MREQERGTAHLDLAAVRRAIAARVGMGVRRGLRLRQVRLLSLAEAIVLTAWAPYWLEWTIASARVSRDRKSTRLNSSHSQKSYSVFFFEKKKKKSRKTR